MKYESVAQGERDALADATPAAATPSPAPNEVEDHPLPAYAAGQESHPENHGQPVLVPDERHIGSILRSLTSSHSYEVVDSNDYGEAKIAPLRIRNQNDSEVSKDPNAPQVWAKADSTPVRTASISRHLPLSHPTPDLQSLQGAYVKNVERLEESAERLSMTSLLEDELQKMRSEQRRTDRDARNYAGDHGPSSNSHHFSAESLSNSIVGVNIAARSGAYSPSAHVISPRGSLRSGSWSQPSVAPAVKHFGYAPQILEIDYEDSPLDLRLTDPSTRRPAMESVHADLPDRALPLSDDHIDPDSDDRPPTPASNDAYRKATNLFQDFDGVHYTTHQQAALGRHDPTSRRVSLSHPPLAADRTAHREPQPGQNMVYYPAPVPVLLNLPQRLSKLPSLSERERRRLHGISGIPDEMRRSAPWLKDEADVVARTQRRGTQEFASIPPQLRASAFFDPPSKPLDVQLVGTSAVETLDSILDASAHAPVSAFTDHPIVGRLGREVYGPEAIRHKSSQGDEAERMKRRSSVSNMLSAPGGRRSSSRMSNLLSTIQPRTASSRLTSRESKALADADASAEVADQPAGLHALDQDEKSALEAITPGEDEIVEGGGGSIPGAREEHEEQEEDHDEDHYPAYLGPPTTLLAELQIRKAQQKQRNRTAADTFPHGMRSTLLELDAVTQLQQKSRKLKHVTLAWEDHEAADRKNFDDEDVPLGMLFAGRKAREEYDRPVGLMEKRDMEDNEPLSQRRARLRGDPPSSKVAGPITRERPSTVYTLNVPNVSPPDVPEQEDETLAQRLQRLKTEREKPGDFANEIASQLGLLKESTLPTSKIPDAEETLGQRRKRLKEEMATTPGLFYGPTHLPHLRGQMQHATTGAHSNTAFQFSTPSVYSPSTALRLGDLGVQPYVQNLLDGPPLDPKQRANIDRWRQEIVQ